MLNYEPVCTGPDSQSVVSGNTLASNNPATSIKSGQDHRAISIQPVDDWDARFQTMIDSIELNASKEIVRSPPMISLNGQGFIWKKTINIIQGKFGSHKSRLSELLCALLLKSKDCSTDFLGFKRDEMHVYSGAYVDTERNKAEQFPLAIQQVRKLAGLPPFERSRNLIPCSLIEFSRKERLLALKKFIEKVMRESSNHLLILLDVVTDCIGDFNNSSESLELFDFLNRLINDHDITLLLIIHENPGTDKARGHAGTEAANKASTIMQIGFEKGANNKDSDLITVKVLKLRNGKKPDPLYLYFDEKQHRLALADREMVNNVIEDRRKKVDLDMLSHSLGNLLTEPQDQQTLLKNLSTEFEAHENTLKKRLKELAEKKIVIYSLGGIMCELLVEGNSGKSTTYSLVPTTNE